MTNQFSKDIIWYLLVVFGVSAVCQFLLDAGYVDFVSIAFDPRRVLDGYFGLLITGFFFHVSWLHFFTNIVFVSLLLFILRLSGLRRLLVFAGCSAIFSHLFAAVVWRVFSHSDVQIVGTSGVGFSFLWLVIRTKYSGLIRATLCIALALYLLVDIATGHVPGMPSLRTYGYIHLGGALAGEFFRPILVGPDEKFD